MPPSEAVAAAGALLTAAQLAVGAQLEPGAVAGAAPRGQVAAVPPVAVAVAVDLRKVKRKLFQILDILAGCGVISYRAVLLPLEIEERLPLPPLSGVARVKQRAPRSLSAAAKASVSRKYAHCGIALAMYFSPTDPPLLLLPAAGVPLLPAFSLTAGDFLSLLRRLPRPGDGALLLLLLPSGFLLLLRLPPPRAVSVVPDRERVEAREEIGVFAKRLERLFEGDFVEEEPG